MHPWKIMLLFHHRTLPHRVTATRAKKQAFFACPTYLVAFLQGG
jgi:hypothetical protein